MVIAVRRRQQRLPASMNQKQLLFTLKSHTLEPATVKCMQVRRPREV